MNTAEDIVNDKNQQILTVSFDDTVQTACEFMVGNKIGAVLVEKNEEYVGVWTERDLLHNITKEGFDPKFWKDKECYRCHLKGHPASHCPNKTVDDDDDNKGRDQKHVIVIEQKERANSRQHQ